MRNNDNELGSSLMRSESGVAHVIITVLLFLLLVTACALGYIFVYSQHRVQLNTLLSDMQKHEIRLINIERVTESWGKKINLTNPGVQKVDTVFYVSKVKVEKYLTGVKVRGLMINSSSLEHNDARFRITINNKSREFAIKKISPGSSKKFVVEVPDIPVEKAVEADVKTLASSVSYFID